MGFAFLILGLNKILHILAKSKLDYKYILLSRSLHQGFFLGIINVSKIAYKNVTWKKNQQQMI